MSWGAGGENLRAEMLDIVLEVARAKRPPRNSGTKLLACKLAIEALDKQREWDQSQRDRDPAAFVERMLGDPQRAREWLVTMLQRIDAQQAPQLPSPKEQPDER